jgi:hypothetical protein
MRTTKVFASTMNSTAQVPLSFCTMAVLDAEEIGRIGGTWRS